MTIGQSVLIAMFCMIAVFIALVALWVIIRLFSVIIIKITAKGGSLDVH